MRKLVFLFLIGLTQLTGCAGQMMLSAKNQTLPSLSPEKSRVVFMRSAFHGTIVSAGLYEVISEQPKFIGVLANNNKFFIDMVPGKHDFMSVGASVRFLQGSFEAGKTYYVVATPRGWPGINFSLNPVRSSGDGKFNFNTPEYNTIVADTVLVIASPEATKWGSEMQDSVNNGFKVEWPIWKDKPDTFKAPFTIQSSDGI